MLRVDEVAPALSVAIISRTPTPISVEVRRYVAWPVEVLTCLIVNDLQIRPEVHLTVIVGVLSSASVDLITRVAVSEPFFKYPLDDFPELA